MQKIKYILFTFLILSFGTLFVSAECTKEELTTEKEKTNNIKITYKHLGEVVKDDGSKAYNEFLVTARGVEEGQYIHLSPLTNTDFITENNEIKITLTTGKWEYNIYSLKCESVVKTINVNLPKFNIYSLDPLCEGIDGEDFAFCSKYLNYEVSRETFERKVNEYKRNMPISDTQISKDELNINDIMFKVLDFISNNNLYIVGVLLIILIILLIIIINRKKKKRNVLE